jgi:hypothetical protein
MSCAQKTDTRSPPHSATTGDVLAFSLNVVIPGNLAKRCLINFVRPSFSKGAHIFQIGARRETLKAVSQTLGVAENTVRGWRDRDGQEGLQMLHDKPLSGRPVELDGGQRVKMTALACSEAPVGHERWTFGWFFC